MSLSLGGGRTLDYRATSDHISGICPTSYILPDLSSYKLEGFIGIVK